MKKNSTCPKIFRNCGEFILKIKLTQISDFIRRGRKIENCEFVELNPYFYCGLLMRKIKSQGVDKSLKQLPFLSVFCTFRSSRYQSFFLSFIYYWRTRPERPLCTPDERGVKVAPPPPLILF